MSAPNARQNIEQEVEGDRNVFTGTGDIHIHNYNYNHPAPLPSSTHSEREEEAIPRCPYLGLSHFSHEFADFFFGRERITEELLAATKKQNFIALTGASGSGKSSVVFAGLVPRLYQSGRCLLTYFRPRDDPFLELARAVLPLYDPDLTRTDLLKEARKLAQDFRKGEVSLSEVNKEVLYTHPDHRIFLIADQFEELYTLSNDTVPLHQFIELLLNGLTPGSLSFTLILTIRADFLGQAYLHRGFADALQGASQILGPMTREELTRAIEEPAKRLKVDFETGLIDRILDDVGEEPGNLPLLEFALTELWGRQKNRCLNHVAYEEIGEVKGALNRYADTVINKLDHHEKVQAQRIFVQLVKPGEGTEDTRRLATRAELEEHWSLVAKLATKRLVVTNKVEVQETVEVIHETLINNWQPLRRWMREDRVFRTWQERLRDDLNKWEELEREENALLYGYALGEATDWIKRRPKDLSEAEKEFIHASMAEKEELDKKRRRQLQQRYLALVGIILSVVVMTVLAIYSMDRMRVASQPNSFFQAVAVLEALAGENTVPEENVLAVLLAIETVQAQAPGDTLVILGCQKVSRNLTRSEWERFLGRAPYHATCSNLPPHANEQE